jgi:hypothetical protein
MQELNNSIKRSNLRIMVFEGQEVQAKSIRNIFNKTITENFPNLTKVCPFRYKKPLGHQIDLIKIDPPRGILSLKQAQKSEKECHRLKKKKKSK